MTKRKDGSPAVYKPCARCGESHHHWSRCGDGVLLNLDHRAKPFVKGDARFRHQAQAPIPPEPEPQSPSEEPAAPAPPIPEAEVARADLRAMIAALPEESQQRRSLELLLARDEARTAHADAERDLQARTGNPEARLPVPNIIREKNEKRARFLEGQLAQTFAAANIREKPTFEEARATKEMLAAIPEQRAEAEAKAKEAATMPKHVSGDTVWLCENPGQKCTNKSFRSASMEYVRKKAAAEPDWKFVCPLCGGSKVRLSMLQAVA